MLDQYCTIYGTQESVLEITYLAPQKNTIYKVMVLESGAIVTQNPSSSQYHGPFYKKPHTI